MSPHPQHLLSCLAEAMQQRRDLVQALRESGIAGAGPLADQLAAGRPLDQALAEVLPADLARAFAGPHPDPAATAALLGDWVYQRRKNLRELQHALLYPLVSFALLLLGLGVIIVLGVVQPPWLLLSLVVLLALAGGLCLPWWAQGGGAQPNRHQRQAEAWASTALLLSWRADEQMAERWFGPQVARLLQHCGGLQGASEHCRTMAAYYHQASARHLRYWALLSACWIHCCGAALAIAVAVTTWQAMYDQPW
ncbi:MAG: hypothetical protein EA402_13755 [Planctomycetota bacterium]|nr:MAG: hypothetical protein EA402_13755 [Planctomycetota bacterium]